MDSGRAHLVNGKVVTTPGTQADPVVDRIAVDGKVINRLEPKVYYLLNKPTGYVSTCEDELGRPTVLDLLKPVRFRLFPVGRLDWDSEGLLLLTNDGELMQRLLHPRFHIRRTYLAKVEGIPTVHAWRRPLPGTATPPSGANSTDHQGRSAPCLVRDTGGQESPGPTDVRSGGASGETVASGAVCRARHHGIITWPVSTPILDRSAHSQAFGRI